MPKPMTSSREIRFYQALAHCHPGPDILANLCLAAGLPVSFLALERRWPWLNRRVSVPCRCPILHPSVLITLCHLYDRHLLDRADWSLARVLRWANRIQQQMESMA